jgi:hypothetical protein
MSRIGKLACPLVAGLTAMAGSEYSPASMPGDDHSKCKGTAGKQEVPGPRQPLATSLRTRLIATWGSRDSWGVPSWFGFTHDGKYALAVQAEKEDDEENLQPRGLRAKPSKRFSVWDVATGREVRTFQGHEAPVLALAFSPDGQPSPVSYSQRTASRSSRRDWTSRPGSGT